MKKKRHLLGEVVRPDFSCLNDLLSAPQDKVGCKPLLSNLVWCPPIIKDHGCLRSSSFNYFGFIAQGVSSFFQQEPWSVDVRNAAKTGLTLVASERNVALTKAVSYVQYYYVFTVPWNCLGRGGISWLHPCFFFRCRVWSPQREQLAEIGRATTSLMSDPGIGDDNRPTSGSPSQKTPP